MSATSALYDTEAEIAVLGSMILDRDAYRAIAEIVQPNHFYHGPHADVFRAIDRLAQDDEAIDATLLAAAMRKAGTLDRVGGTAFIVRVMSSVPTVANATHYATLVRDLAKKRDLIAAADRYAAAARNGTEEVEWKTLVATRQAGEDSPSDRTSPTETEWDLAATLKLPAPEPPDELIERLITRPSVNIAFGPPSSGKSWAVMQAVVDCVFGGGPFMGNPDLAVFPLRNDVGEPQDRVLWIFGSEDTPRRIQTRLRAILDASGRSQAEVPPGIFTYATPPAGIALGTPGGWKWIRDLLDRLKPTILILDTIASLTGEALDASDAGDVVPFMRHLHQLRDSLGVTIFGLHHTRKANADARSAIQSKADAMLGSQAWRSMADAVLMLDAKDGDATDVSVRLVKSKDMDRPAPTFHSSLEAGLFRFVRWADEEATVPATPRGKFTKINAGDVLSLLDRSGGSTPWQSIYVPLGYSKSAWFRHRARVLGELAGKVELDGGTLRLTT